MLRACVGLGLAGMHSREGAWAVEGTGSGEASLLANKNESPALWIM